jgi:hypothetical protein
MPYAAMNWAGRLGWRRLGAFVILARGLGSVFQIWEFIYEDSEWRIGISGRMS